MKISKYTIFIEDDNNNLILYNSLEGIRSICKISNRYLHDIQHYDEGGESFDEGLSDYLVKKGHLIEDHVNESAKLRALYLKTISDNILNLIILPTEQCNFRCKYCYESFALQGMGKEIQKSTISFVKKNIHKFNGLHVMWFGGEPLLELRIIREMSHDLMKICIDNRKVYTAQITTNAYSLTPEVFGELLTYGIRDYQVTIDGIQTIHDKARVLANGKGTFTVIFDNILNIKRRYNKQRFRVVIRTNLTKDILEYVDDYITTCNKITDNDERFKIDIQFVNNWMDKAEEGIKDQLIIDKCDFLKKLYENKEGLKNIFIGDFQPGGAACPNGKLNSYLIRANGDIHKCTMCFENSSTAVGNIQKEISWNSFYNWLCQWDYCGKLSNCEYAPLCFGDYCPAQRILMPEEEYTCPRVRELAKSYLKLLDKIGFISNNYDLTID